MSTVPSLPFWDSQMVGPDAYKPAASVRTPTDPGRPIAPGELVLVSAPTPMSIQLPDPRLSPGKSLAISRDAGVGTITFVAYPGTTIHGGTSWAWASPLAWGGMVFVSTGSEWRSIARFPGV